MGEKEPPGDGGSLSLSRSPRGSRGSRSLPTEGSRPDLAGVTSTSNTLSTVSTGRSSESVAIAPLGRRRQDSPRRRLGFAKASLDTVQLDDDGPELTTLSYRFRYGGTISCGVALVVLIGVVASGVYCTAALNERIADLGGAEGEISGVGALLTAATAVLFAAAMASVRFLSFNESKQIQLANERAQTRLMSYMSHEMRNPLFALRGLLDTDAEEVARGNELSGSRGAVMIDDATFQRVDEAVLTPVRAQVSYMQHVLDDVLDIRALSDGNFKLRSVPCDPALLISETANMFRPVLEQSVVLSVDADPSVTEHRFIIDATRLRQLANNALHNAYKATPDGRISVAAFATVERNRSAVERSSGAESKIEGTRARPWVCLAIINSVTGPLPDGVSSWAELRETDAAVNAPRDVLDDVNDWLERISGSTATEGYGVRDLPHSASPPGSARHVRTRKSTGVGLRLCHLLARRMGGWMWLTDDERNSMVRFVVLVPSKGYAAAVVSPRQIAVSASGKELPSVDSGGGGSRDSGRLILVDGAPSSAGAALQGHPSSQSVGSAGMPSDDALHHVLLIDDEATVLRVCAKLCVSAGLQVTAIRDGDCAADAIASGAGIAWILMDLGMVRSDGRDVCRALRASGVTLPIYAVTGSTDEDTAQECRDAGFDGIVGKPFDLDAVRAAHRHAKRVAAARRQPAGESAGDEPDAPPEWFSSVH